MSVASVSPRADLARGSALSFAGSAANAALGLLLVVVLGRLLGDAGAGVVLQTIAIFTIALGVARLGMDSAALWILPRLADDAPGALRPTTTLLVAASGIAGTASALVVGAGAAWLAASDPSDEVARALAGVCWFLPPAAMLATALASTRGLGGVLPYTLVGGVALPALRPVAVALAAGTGGGLAAIALAWAAPVVLVLAAAVLVLAAQLRRRSAHGTPWPAYRASGVPGRIGRYAAPRVVSESLSQILAWLDIVIVGAIAGPAAAGVYGGAARIASAGTLVDSAIRVVVSPAFSRLLHRGDRAGVADVFRAATIWLVLFSTPVYLLLAVFAPVVLSVLGPSFVHGEVALAALCAGAIVTFLAGNVHSVLLMGGRSGLAAVNKAAAVAVDVALLFLLVPAWGIAGAAVAWAVACLVDAALATVQVHRVLRLPVPVTAGLHPLAIALVTVGGAAVGARLLLGATWLGLAAAAVVGGAALLAWARGASARLHLDAFAELARLRRIPSGDRP
ncbi:polysaccharide biosynthesis C-terminal domain-containing protein [Microbacterium betulae]|uniref:Polysaccharide biosynthesis C-terminal domain-containing protein n=1 Tax=Microbacterium betulae TaxID=2981139 RepID=A0AA97I611_9MICO|nr:polysaccharide biosynthesis C-terminal domain-containing protein [Microbacterium sp. AB]WOF22632.1 polysaccharide biosynthesis C-terminal domain-containing protein [Microbacterium sp. AB]